MKTFREIRNIISESSLGDKLWKSTRGSGDSPKLGMVNYDPTKKFHKVGKPVVVHAMVDGYHEDYVFYSDGKYVLAVAGHKQVADARGSSDNAMMYMLDAGGSMNPAELKTFAREKTREFVDRILKTTDVVRDFSKEDEGADTAPKSIKRVPFKESVDIKEKFLQDLLTPNEFRRELEQEIEDAGYSPKVIKKITKKGKGYEVRVASYMGSLRDVFTNMGASKIDFKKGGGVNIIMVESVDIKEGKLSDEMIRRHFSNVWALSAKEPKILDMFHKAVDTSNFRKKVQAYRKMTVGVFVRDELNGGYLDPRIIKKLKLTGQQSSTYKDLYYEKSIQALRGKLNDIKEATFEFVDMDKKTRDIVVQLAKKNGLKVKERKKGSLSNIDLEGPNNKMGKFMEQLPPEAIE